VWGAYAPGTISSTQQPFGSVEPATEFRDSRRELQQQQQQHQQQAGQSSAHPASQAQGGGAGKVDQQQLREQQQQQQQTLPLDTDLAVCQEGLFDALPTHSDQTYMLRLAEALGVGILLDRDTGQPPEWAWLQSYVPQQQYLQQRQQQRQQQQGNPMHGYRTGAPPPAGSMDMYAWMQRLQQNS